MGVNVSSFVRYFVRADRKSFWSFIVPMMGFLICLYLWLSLGKTAKTAGLIWLGAGVLYGAWRTSWFRKPLDFGRIEDSDESTGPVATEPSLRD
jgi:hypothetical protein